MKKITIATFNCENLFQRYKRLASVKLSDFEKATKDGFIFDKKLFEKIKEPERDLTAKAIKETKADIIALQEVECLDTLKSFRTHFIKEYPFQYVIDANDPRLIDVGMLSKIEAKYLKTHQFDVKGKSKIFSRDCLEVEFDFDGVPLTLFVNHFKSMLGGRDETMDRRKMQSERVVQIIKDKFGNNPGKENFIIMGDLNDYMPSAGLNPLVSQPWLENVIKTRIPNGDNWTHWFKSEKSVSQLDYLLLSKRLSTSNPDAIPVIIRKGLALKATQYPGPRFSGIGNIRPAASDHCPVAITLNIS